MSTRYIAERIIFNTGKEIKKLNNVWQFDIADESVVLEDDSTYSST